MRYYSSTAVVMALTGAVNEIVTTIVVDTVLGLPAQTPFTLVVDVGLSTEEIVTVTGVSGTNLTVTRGEDSSTAVAHTAGAIVRHMMTARDLREPAVHVAATTYVHGIGATASVVGTDTAQTLTNKTINFADNTAIGVPQASVTDLVDDLAALEVADAALVDDIAALVVVDEAHAAALVVANAALAALVVTDEAHTAALGTLPFAMAAGTSYGGAVSTYVGFPFPRFTVVPVILKTNNGNPVAGSPEISSASINGFWYQNPVNANSTLAWLAIQMTSTTAGG